MKKRNKFITILLILVLCASLCLTLIACDTGNGDDPDEVTDSGKFISNGNFEITTSTDFPKVPESWSGSTGSTATDNETLSDEKSLASGVISTAAKEYDKNKKLWGKLPNPGKQGNDDNILMIYNKVPTAYKFVSNSISLKSNKYYKMQVSVKTVDISGYGVSLKISGDTYKEFVNINTLGEWSVFEFYFETSNSNDNSVSLTLSNGKDGKNDGNLSKGYAFFDNIVVEELESIEGGLTAMEQYNAVTAVTNKIAKQSMILPDSSFENISGKENPFTPNKWSGVSSSGTNGTAPTGSDYLQKGVVDLTKTRPEAIPENIKAEKVVSDDNNILYINNKERTAYGYRADNKIRFMANKHYKLNIRIATILDNSNATGSGAYARLKSTSDATDRKDEILIGNTNGEWKDVTFIINSDEKRNKDLYLEFFLGEGGKGDPKLVKGQLFVDNISIEEFEAGNVPEITTEYKHEIDLNTTQGENTMEESNNSSDWEKGRYGTTDGIDTSNLEYLNKNVKNWDETFGKNPLSPISSIENILVIRNKIPTVTKIRTKGIENILPNNYYRLGIWVKTDILKKTQGLTVNLYEYKANELNEDNKYSKILSFDNINTLAVKNSQTASYNDYIELVFLIEGDALLNKEIYLELSLGSGTFVDATQHVIGSAYVADISLHSIGYADYSNESGNYIKKHSFKSSANTISNSDFNNINVQDTLKIYDSIIDENNPLLDKEGFINGTFGVPKDWTYSDNTLLEKQLNAGIVHTGSSALANKLNTTFDDTFYKGFDKYFPTTSINKKNNPNILVVNTKGKNDDYKITEPTRLEVCGCDPETNPECAKAGYCDGTKCIATCDCAHKAYDGTIKPWGFTSPSISLNKNSYYLVSVWAKVMEGTASITLSTSSKNQSLVHKISANDGTNWERYDFYIETGFDDVKANLDLFLGIKGVSTKTSGTVYFDMPTMSAIDKDTYDAAVSLDADQGQKTALITSYTTTYFDNTTDNSASDSLDTPTSWTGTQEDTDSPRGENKQIAGVYNRDHSSRSWFGLKDNESTVVTAENMLKIFNTLQNNLIKDYIKDNKLQDGASTPFDEFVNNNVLVINNKEATEYTFTNTLAKSLSSKGYYEISVYVLTHMLAKDATANISLKLNNNTYEFSKNNEFGINVNTSSYDANGNETLGEWTRYSFFLYVDSNKDIDNVSISLGLGKTGEDNYVSGYAFFDNVTIAKIDEEEFNNKAPEDTYDKSHVIRKVLKDADIEKDPDEEPETETDPLMWLYITSGIFGGILVIVLVVVIFKKFYKPRKKTDKNVAKKGKETYNKSNIEKNKSAPITSNVKRKYDEKSNNQNTTKKK